jgi:dihydrofolate reductase
MPLPRIEGYAIVSADGMLANAQGIMPPEMYFDADQAFFHEALEHADALVHGRNSHERYPPTAHKPRITATRSVRDLVREKDNAGLWNPAGARVETACEALNIMPGTLAVIGGTDIFGLFLPYYDTFYLSHAPSVRLPGGRPVFPQVPELSPQDVLKRHGFVLRGERSLDAAAKITLAQWEPENRAGR